jgi:hypothetical protein
MWCGYEVITMLKKVCYLTKSISYQPHVIGFSSKKQKIVYLLSRPNFEVTVLQLGSINQESKRWATLGIYYFLRHLPF